MTEEPSLPVVRVDFQNADARGNVRLNTAATVEDLTRHQIELRPGLELRLFDGELSAVGRVDFNSDERVWVAEVSWQEVVSADTS